MDKPVIIAGLWCLLFLARTIAAQEKVDQIRPMVSVRQDVLTALGKPSRVEPSKLVYEFGSSIVTVTFYKSGCSAETEKRLRLIPGTVLELKTVFITGRSISDIFRDSSSYEVYSGHGGQKLHYDASEGIVITSLGHGETAGVKEVFRIPVRESLDNCLLTSFDNESGIAELHFFGAMKSVDDRYKFPPIEVGKYFEQDSRKAKDEIVNEFVDNLSANEKRVGFIMVTVSEKEAISTMAEKEEKLLELLKKKGIGCARFGFVYGGVAPFAGASFVVVHRSFFDKMGARTACK